MAYGRDAETMSIGSVFSRAFAAVGAAPLTYFGVSFVLATLPYALFLAAMHVTVMQPVMPGTAAQPRPWGMFALAALGYWLAYQLARVVLTRLTVAEFDREPVSIGDLASAAIRALLPVFGLSLIVTLSMMVGALLLLVPAIVIYLLWAVATPALIAERRGVFAALGRSARLTRGARWRILGLSMIVWVIYFLSAGVVAAARMVIEGPPVAGAAPSWLQLGSEMVLQMAVVTIWTAIQATLYVELRDEKDGPAGERLADIFA